MNKKFILAGLIGAFALTSCVDTDESDSVVNVRNAQAAKLNAEAELFKAQAQSATVTAQAEATLKAAEAQYQQALAEKAKAQIAEVEANAAYQKALAAAQEAQAELTKVQAQIQKDQADATLKQMEVQLQSDLAQLEATLAQVETQKEQAEYQKAFIQMQIADLENQMEVAKYTYKTNLITAESTLAAAEIQKKIDDINLDKKVTTAVSTAQSAYNKAVGELNDLNLALYTLQVNYIKNNKYTEAASDIAGAFKTNIKNAKDEISNQNDIINAKEKTIKFLEETKGNVAKRDAQVAEKTAELQKLQLAAKALDKAYIDAKQYATVTLVDAGKDPLKSANKAIADAENAIMNLNVAPGLYTVKVTKGTVADKDATKYQYTDKDGKKQDLETYKAMTVKAEVNANIATAETDLKDLIEAQKGAVKIAQDNLNQNNADSIATVKKVNNLQSLLAKTSSDGKIKIVDQYLYTNADVLIGWLLWDQPGELVKGSNQYIKEVEYEVSYNAVKTAVNTLAGTTFNGATLSKALKAATDTQAGLEGLQAYVKDQKTLNDKLQAAVDAKNKLFTDAYEKMLEAYQPSYDNAKDQAALKAEINEIQTMYFSYTEMSKPTATEGNPNVSGVAQEWIEEVKKAYTSVVEPGTDKPSYELTEAALKTAIDNCNEDIKKAKDEIAKQEGIIADQEVKLAEAEKKDADIIALGNNAKLVAEQQIAAKEAEIAAKEREVNDLKAILDAMIALGTAE